jgi:hypothetical protein
MSERRIVIFGTWHHFPYGQAPHDHHHRVGFEDHLREFDKLIRLAIERHGVVGVVEEIGDDVLKADMKGETHLGRTARAQTLPYRNTDLTSDERSALGLVTGAERGTPAWVKLQDAREARWLRDLRGYGLWPALFVCGGVHSKRFYDLSAHNELDPIIEVGYWDPPARDSSRPWSSVSTPG